MSDQQVERIERAIDRPVANAMTVNRSSGGTFTVAPQNMGELLEFAKLMSVSGFCVRPAFRGNPGACLGVALQAFRCGGDPFAWANKAYITRNKSGEEQISYEAQLVHAIVNSSSVLQRRLRPTYEGEGQARCCIVVGWVKGEGQPLEYRSPPVSQVGVKNSPLWTSDPDQQLFYYSTRAWARRHVPEILLGIYAPEEFAETIDITPEAEPRREDFISDNRRPEPIDERPEFAVWDNDGVEHALRAGDKAADALAAVFTEAARHNLARLEGAWDNNQAVVEQLAREGFPDEAVGLSQQYEGLRKDLTSRPASAAAAEHPGADHEQGTAEAVELGGVSARGDEHAASSGEQVGRPSEGERRATAEVERPAAVAGGPLPPSGGEPHRSPPATEAPATANGPANREPPHSAPAAAPATASGEVRPFPGDLPSKAAAEPAAATDERGPEFLIPVPLRSGKPDYRTWAVALFMPKVRQFKEGDRLAFLIGDNDQNLIEARKVLSKDDLAQLEATIEEAQRAAVWPS